MLKKVYISSKMFWIYNPHWWTSSYMSREYSNNASQNSNLFFKYNSYQSYRWTLAGGSRGNSFIPYYFESAKQAIQWCCRLKSWIKTESLYQSLALLICATALPESSQFLSHRKQQKKLRMNTHNSLFTSGSAKI